MVAGLKPSPSSRTRGTAAPASAQGSKPSTQMGAIVVALLIVVVAIAGVYYFAVYSKPASTGGFSERVRIDIGGYYYNSTDPSQSTPAGYYPPNFNVSVGATVTLFITNTDNVTHGLSVPKFNVDTGPMMPNATATLTFTTRTAGNYTYSEPVADCGGGSCDSNSSLADMTGWFLVTS